LTAEQFFRFVKNPMIRRMLVYTVSDGISKAIPFLVLPVIARYLTVEDFGLVSNFTVLVELFAAFVAFSAYFSLGVDYYKKDRPTLVSNLVVMISLLFAAAFILIVLFNGVLYTNFRITLQWQIYALITAYFNSINQLYTTKLRYDEKARFFGFLQMVRASVSAGLSLLLVIGLDWSWQGRAFSLLATGLLLFLISVVMMFREGVILKNVQPKIILGAMTFGISLLPQNLVGWLRSGYEKSLVTRQVGLGGNGLISFAGTIASIFLLFSTAFFSTYTPFLFKSLTRLENEPQHRDEILRDILKKAYLFLGFLLGAILAGYFLTILLINMFFKDDYQGAKALMPLALVTVFLSALSSWLSSFLLFKKKTKLLAGITISQTLVQLALTWYMVTHYSTIGAQYASVLGNLLLNAILAWFVTREYRMPWLRVYSVK